MKIIKIIFLFLLLGCVNSWIVNTEIPKTLWGKKLMLNGPRQRDEFSSFFDGTGHITSIVFKEDEAVISEVILPEEKKTTFPLSDFLKRDYFKMFMKLPHVLMNPKSVQSGTRNTAVCKFNKNYYAVEESCSPAKLSYNDRDELEFIGIDKHIKKMGVHMPDDYTMFSYAYPEKEPLKLNDTFNIPWTPEIFPLMVHDCKITENKRFYIFPIMSTSIGRFGDYISKLIPMPFNNKGQNASWLIYDKENHKSFEIEMNEFVDLFHIAHVENLYKDVYKIYASFIYNFPSWLSGKGDLDIRLKEVILDFDKQKVIKIKDIGLKMDFIYKKGDNLIGSCLDDKPGVYIYNMKNKQQKKINVPGDTVREIIPIDDLLLYFSHDNHRSHLYIVDLLTGTTINKIRIPHRLPGFHTSLFD